MAVCGRGVAYHPHDWAVSAAHCRLKAMETEMITGTTVTELWESDVDYGYLYLRVYTVLLQFYSSFQSSEHLVQLPFTLATSNCATLRKSAPLYAHEISEINDRFALTESEL